MSIASRIAGKMNIIRWRILRATKRTVTLNTKQGRLSVFTQDEVIGRLLFLHRHFQHDTTQRALTHLRALGLIPPRGEGVVLDVGANIGVISIGMLVNGEVAGAVGIEPEPANFALLERNLAHNGLASRYVQIRAAVSDHADELGFALSPDNLGDHRIRAADGESNGRVVITVPAHPIDDVVGRLPIETAAKISVVWIDVQGHEGYVFAGGAQLFARDIPVIAEVWPFGLLQSGMTLEQFAEIAQRYWSSFWVWRRANRYVRYPTTDLLRFCEELGEAGEHDDVIFTRA